MNETTENTASAREKLFRTALALALALSGVLATLSATAGKAYAEESSNLEVGGSIYYGGYATTHFTADGEIAYCADPEASTPSAGSYAKHAIEAKSGRTSELVADLWFGYGGPGFDKSMWPSRWYDGSDMTASNYQALTHILLSDTYSSSSDYAMYGCTEGFRDWVQENVLGFGDDGSIINADATGRQIADRIGEVKGGFDAFMLRTGSGSQIILSFSYTPYGSIDLIKTSANTDVSDGNACYDLAGAEYTVCKDAKCADAVGTITTDRDGYGRLDELEPGTYYVKETKAAEGYALDSSVYRTKVESDQTTRVNGKSVSDTPQSNPIGMLLGKVDATTNAARPEGAAALADARFSVKYYDGLYGSADEATASGDPTRSWTFKTDSDGLAYYSDAYKVAGDELYHQTDGNASIPLGTIVVEETKAPVGYNLGDGHDGRPDRFCIQITSDGVAGESVHTYNSPTQPDTVKRGDFRLVKEVPVTVYDDADNPQEVRRVLVSGVQFQLINENDSTVVSPETGSEVEKGGVVCTITTDEDGLATTKALTLPDGWTGALAYGTYTVHEVIPDNVAADFKAAYGKDLIAVPDWKTTVSDEGQYDTPALVDNHIPQTPLKVVKTDAETGKQIPLQCSFQLKDAQGRLVTYTSHYPEESTLDTWTTNANGEVTLPMLLEEGTYTICEVQAPYGYVLDLEGRQFSVGSVYNGWDDPIVIDFEDMPQKGVIKVAKHDSTTGEAVPDSTYIVKAATDIVTPEGTVRADAGDIVATLVTDGNGEASTPELYLGSYTVYEAKAMDGYALNVDEETVSLEYQGQEIGVFTCAEPVTDTPTEIKLHKVDATDSEVPVAGATFRIWNDEGTFDEEYVTDKDGDISVKYIKHGDYHVQETAAPDGYIIYDVDDNGTPRVHDFTANDQGMISFDGSTSMVDVFEWTVENMPKNMKTTATDSASTTHEGQGREKMSIIDTVEYSGCIPGKEYTVTGTLMDKATGGKALDADGKEITASATFKAEAFQGTIDITFEFDGAELAGHDVVAFETMTHDGKEYMVHADVRDEGQTVKIVDIHTTATNPATGDNLGSTAEKLELTDKVAYENLTPGNGYKLFTSLYDSEAGAPILDEHGTQLVVESDFTCEKPDGTADVSMTIDSKDVAGHTLVFFEKLTDSGDNVIATHEDADDDGQSIHFAGIHTNAVDADDGDKNVIADETAQVTDTVTYENLVPGREYVLTGKLMDKATGEALKDADGNEIVSTATFTPEKADGTADVAFEFDGSKLTGTTAVVFETLTRNGIEIAAHADIDDADQTVELCTPEEGTSGKGYPKTGGNVPVAPVAASILVLVGCGTAGAAWAASRRRRGSAAGSGDETGSGK